MLILLLSILCANSYVPVEDIQQSLQKVQLDGWLFYDFRKSDLIAYRILPVKGLVSRRWYYYIPSKGTPSKIVHAIEEDRLDNLEGKKFVYRKWQQIPMHLKNILFQGRESKEIPKIAMQYSPNNDIPYVSKVDAGTMEMIRSLGVKVVTSAPLVQKFESTWSKEQFQMHKSAAIKQQKIMLLAFDEIKKKILNNSKISEYDILVFIDNEYKKEGMMAKGSIVAVNENTADPHYFPTKEKSSLIKKGDLVLIDTVTKLNKEKSIATDITWMGYVGTTIPKKYNDVWKIVKNARDSAFTFIKESIQAKRVIKGSEVDDVARGIIQKAGYEEKFLHRTGHSIGEEFHGNGANIDNLETHETREIIPHTGFSIEPGIYIKGQFGIRSEIDVYVSENDAIITAPMQDEILCLLL